MEVSAQRLQIFEFSQFDPVHSPVVFVQGSRSGPLPFFGTGGNETGILNPEGVPIAVKTTTQNNVRPEVSLLNTILWDTEL
jgi:hypothetical protein